MTQKSIAELFACSTDNISLHLKNIFKENELDSNSVTEEFSATASDGKKYKMKFYNLDAIISVGYRVNQDQLYKSDFDLFIEEVEKRKSENNE